MTNSMQQAGIKMEDVLDKTDDRFMLTLGAARRARQLKDGANPLVAYSEPRLPVIIALKEIQCEKINIVILEEEAS